MRLHTSAFTTLFVATAISAAAAQSTTGSAVLYGVPGNNPIATIAQGMTVNPGGTSGEFVRVTLRGYIATSLLAGKRDSFPATVGATEARLRASPSTSATVVAQVQQGMGVHILTTSGTWSQVERTGWIRRSALPSAQAQPDVPKPADLPKRPAQQEQAPQQPAPKPQTTPPSAKVTPPAPTASQPDSTPPLPAGAVTPSDSAYLSPAPGGAPLALVRHGAVLTPIARDRGWVRVQVDGWMREGDLVAADSSVARLSAADLRASPDQYVGKVVRWTVTALAFQTADPLRLDMRPNEPYLLARGPGSENALLYLAVPPSLVEKAKSLSPMTKLVIVARVRTGRANPSGVPILDVQAMTRTNK